MTELPHMEVAIESLKSGTADMLAMSIEQWKSLDVEGLKISAFLPRREPTWVLVGDDKPEYLPLNATVICPKKLIKRQLIRMRPDLLVYDLREFLELEKLIPEIGRGQNRKLPGKFNENLENATTPASSDEDDFYNDGAFEEYNTKDEDIANYSDKTYQT